MINLPGAYSEEEKRKLLAAPDLRLSIAAERFKSSFPGVVSASEAANCKVHYKQSGTFVTFKKTLLKEVNVLSDGASFGEAALVSGNAQRNATILSKTDCYFAILDKDNYERIIGEQLEIELNRRVNFLKNIQMFSFIPDNTIRTMIYFLKVKTFSFRDFIVKRGEPVSDLSIVMRGKVKLMRKRTAVRGLVRKAEVDLMCVRYDDRDDGAGREWRVRRRALSGRRAEELGLRRGV